MSDFDSHRKRWFADLARTEAMKTRARKESLRLMRLSGFVRPLACECLSSRQVEMHHPDYSQPWLVAFLCCRCHVLEHKRNLQRPFHLHDLRKPLEPRLFL